MWSLYEVPSGLSASSVDRSASKWPTSRFSAFQCSWPGLERWQARSRTTFAQSGNTLTRDNHSYRLTPTSNICHPRGCLAMASRPEKLNVTYFVMARKL